MAVVIAGEGGSVLVAASRARDDVAALVPEGVAPGGASWAGAPIHRIEDLASIDTGGVAAVELVAGERSTREAVAAWASSRGVSVRETVLEEADPPRGCRVLAVSSPSTGSGKTALTRKLARSLARSGVATAVVRHPIPSLVLWEDRARPVVVDSAEALDREPRPLEEREELAPVVGAGVPVATGLDPVAVVDAAAGRASVLVWDGGGSAPPWLRADVRVVAVDLLRPLPSGAEGQVRRADAVVLTKADSASPERASEIEAAVRGWNPHASVVLADMPVAVPASKELVDGSAVVVEDWPSLLLGGLEAGAGMVAARRFRCRVVDPREFAVGAIRRAHERHPHLGPVIPSLGRIPEEIADLRASIEATPGDVVLWASPASPHGIVGAGRRPVLRAYAEVVEIAGPSLQELIRPLLPGMAGASGGVAQ